MTNREYTPILGDVCKLQIYTEIDGQLYKWKSFNTLTSGCYNCALVKDNHCIAPACLGNYRGWWKIYSKEV